MNLFEHIVLFIVSFIANAFSAFSGGGAGLIQFPILIFLGLPFTVALATHKVASVALGVGATARHLRESSLNLFFSLFILATGLPAVVLGARTILYVPDQIATFTLGLLTSTLGIYSWRHPSLGQQISFRNRDAKGLLIGALGLFFIGFINGTLTSGSGLFVTIWLVRWFGFDYLLAVAHTMILVGLFWNATGAITLGMQGNIEWAWIPALLIGATGGAYFGSHLAIHAGNRWIKRGFEIVTIIIGVKLMLDAYA